jgi:hypothetical protein
MTARGEIPLALSLIRKALSGLLLLRRAPDKVGQDSTCVDTVPSTEHLTKSAHRPATECIEILDFATLRAPGLAGLVLAENSDPHVLTM